MIMMGKDSFDPRRIMKPNKVNELVKKNISDVSFGPNIASFVDFESGEAILMRQEFSSLLGLEKKNSEEIATIKIENERI